ncbi:c-type cytochrome [Pseudorhizobium sp. NPDC055634]
MKGCRRSATFAANNLWLEAGRLRVQPRAETRSSAVPIFSFRPRVLACRSTLALWGLTTLLLPQPSQAESIASLLQRGEYLVTIGNCDHCHTPGHFLGKRQDAQRLAGSDVGFQIPDVGTIVGPNITPSKTTGIGNWTRAEIIKALRTGERPDGRILSTIMPWPDLAKLTDRDMEAMVAYLRSLPPVERQTPGPFGPGEPVSVHVFQLMPPDVD